MLIGKDGCVSRCLRTTKCCCITNSLPSADVGPAYKYREAELREGGGQRALNTSRQHNPYMDIGDNRSLYDEVERRSETMHMTNIEQHGATDRTKEAQRSDSTGTT